MKKKSAQEENKSIRTFVLYSLLVLLVILVGLAIKLFFIVRESTFDGEHQFVVAVLKDKKIQELISFSSKPPSVSVLTVKGDLPIEEVGKTFAVLPDAQFVKTDTSSFLDNQAGVPVNMTWFDVGRLLLITKQTLHQHRIEKELIPSRDSTKIDPIVNKLFQDATVAEEDITIQIINATTTPGTARRLTRIITNMGGNVVAISTDYKATPRSTIQYFGDESYTLQKLHRLLGFPVKKLEHKAIADIVITIGEDGLRKF